MTLEYVRDTKRFHVFESASHKDPDTEDPIDTLYVRRSALVDGPPKLLIVTAEAATP